MTVLGLHHITLVCADARRTVAFYSGTLGLRLVKRTVNFDDPASYHLYFGDELGRPGTAITFFEWRRAPCGRSGIGGTDHVALQVAGCDGLLKWKRRLSDRGVRVTGPYDRRYFTAIGFKDPDGASVEIATQGPGWTIDELPERSGEVCGVPVVGGDAVDLCSATWPEPVPEITPDMALSRGLHHITAVSADLQRTHAFFSGLLGLRRVKMIADDRWYWGAGDGLPGTLISYFAPDPARACRARIGTGQTHHFALAVAHDEAQLAWREKLLRAGLRVSPVMDRIYFKSIYTNDPDGHIVELATIGPGFAVDESVEELGRHLMLPPWLEPYRSEIEPALPSMPAPEAG